jgi:hypothetical protein
MPLCGIAACDPLPRIVIRELVARRERRPRLERELAGLQARPVVRAEDRLHRELLEQAVLHHLARAAAAFFGRLEDEVDRAVVVAVLRQVLGRGEQHRRVAVVAARVHLAGVRARCAKVLCSVIGSASMSARRPTARALLAVLEDRDDAGRAHAAVDRDAPRRELLGDQVGGALLLEAELGWAWMSRRSAAIWRASARMDSMTCMAGSYAASLPVGPGGPGLCHSLEMVTTVVRAACPHDCPDTCAMLVTVEDGRAIRVHGDPDHRRRTARSAPRSRATSSARTTPIASCGR